MKTAPLLIRSIRDERGQSLDELAAAIGVGSRGYMSRIENGKVQCSPRIALAIEQWSGGRIPAEQLSADVALVVAARSLSRPIEDCAVHNSVNTPSPEGTSPGKPGEVSPGLSAIRLQSLPSSRRLWPKGRAAYRPSPKDWTHDDAPPENHRRRGCRARRRDGVCQCTCCRASSAVFSSISPSASAACGVNVICRS
ncbi:helix-turn-helix domain-containing protein [Sphingomonas hengshuiensis]|uniref:HTH cro/C1-type domain-containing protein n=1 Tax=Sphingomonas hengshuiensis TaxID=1609977 RepID=A0A7U4LFL8_9SPHN|nr:hypothetical protein TS85_11535 [Sphingomonas hengshuiensis]